MNPAQHVVFGIGAVTSWEEIVATTLDSYRSKGPIGATTRKAAS